MSRTISIAIPLLIAALTVGLWAIMNQPSAEPPWPTRIQGYSFSPMRVDDDPTRRIYPTVAEVEEDLTLLQGEAHAIRTYTLEGPMREVPRLAAGHGLNVAVGAWIDANPATNAAQIDLLENLLREGHRNIVRVFVGNEVILRGELSVKALGGHLDRIRRITQTPVGTAEPWHIWLKHPELARHVDFIAVHLLPYWEGAAIEQAVDYSFERLREVQQAFPNKPVIIGEVGWPSNGRRNEGAEPSVVNETRFLRRFLAQAEREGLVYYVMEAFDQPWKRHIEGPVGAYWGVYDVDRKPKFALTQPVVRIPNWRELSALSVGIAAVLLALLYRDSGTLSSSGKGFLALVTYADRKSVV